MKHNTAVLRCKGVLNMYVNNISSKPKVTSKTFLIIKIPVVYKIYQTLLLTLINIEYFSEIVIN